jgi:hypothetical protein
MLTSTPKVDKDGSGLLDKNEIRSLVRKMGDYMSAKK